MIIRLGFKRGNSLVQVFRDAGASQDAFPRWSEGMMGVVTLAVPKNRAVSPVLWLSVTKYFLITHELQPYITH